MNKEVTIITTSLRNDPCDYAKQTMREISKAGLPVSIIWLSERKNSIQWCYDHLLHTTRSTSPSEIEICKIIPFERFEVIKKLNTLLNLFFILTTKKYASEENVFWIFEPFPFFPIKKLFHGTKIYDCTDYFPAISPKVEKTENELINFVDAVFVCNSTLYKKMKKKTSKVFQVEQGFDEETFSSVENLTLNSIRYTKHNEKLTFLFVGTICSRIDFTLLHEVITDNPHIKFVFVGPILKDFQITPTFDQDVENVFTLKNVKYLGVKKRKEIAQLIKNADACLIPYSINNLFNTFSLPLKTLEYFYFGKPVFAIPTPEMKKLKDLVFCFKNKEEFKENIQRLEQEGWNTRVRKRQHHFSLQHTWSKKVHHILQHFLLTN